MQPLERTTDNEKREWQYSKRADHILKSELENTFIPQTKGGTTEVGFLLVFYRSTFAMQDFFPLPPTCLDLPRLA